MKLLWRGESTKSRKNSDMASIKTAISAPTSHLGHKYFVIVFREFEHFS
jgi:hypothetical protein